MSKVISWDRLDKDKNGLGVDDALSAARSFYKFKDAGLRQYQDEAILHAAKSNKKICILELPTGAGKSLIGMTTCRLSSGKNSYLVHSRALQVQLANDFDGVPLLWGRNNYPCELALSNGTDGVMADACVHTAENKCEYIGECEYRAAKAMALAADTRILNYDYFLAETTNVGKFGENQVVIIDEADSLEGALLKHTQVEISSWMAKRFGIGAPYFKTCKHKQGVGPWKEWAGKSIDSVKRQVGWFIANANRCRSKTSNEYFEFIEMANKGRYLMSKLSYFKEHVDDQWMYEEVKGRSGITMVFKPIWIKYGMSSLWDQSTRFVLMSATFPGVEILSNLIGIRVSDTEKYSFPSTFDAKRRQVKMRPVANLVYKDMDTEVPKLLAEIRVLLDKHKDEKGVIHAVSYSLTSKIMGIGDPRLVTHNGSNKIQVLDEFRSSDRPLVLVSPSLERGVSLEGDSCRWIVWAKAPYLSLADKTVNARIYGNRLGNEWYKSNMIQTVIQGAGRGMRSQDDYVTTYLLDNQIVKGMTSAGASIPRWFRDALW